MQVNVLRRTVDKGMNSPTLSNQAYKQLGIQTVTACVHVDLGSPLS